MNLPVFIVYTSNQPISWLTTDNRNEWKNIVSCEKNGVPANNSDHPSSLIPISIDYSFKCFNYSVRYLSHIKQHFLVRN